MRMHAVVINGSGKVFCGISSLSGSARWFTFTDDLYELDSVEALKRKRDARWLALARRYDATAEWKVL